jgi:hypothetical protein
MLFSASTSYLSAKNPERYAVPLTNALVKGDILVAEVVNLSVIFKQPPYG